MDSDLDRTLARWRVFRHTDDDTDAFQRLAQTVECLTVPPTGAFRAAKPVTELAGFMPQPSGTPAAGLLPFATGVGEASAWAAIGATDLPAAGVTPGSYTDADITVDAYGRVTAASAGPGGDKTYTQAFSAGSTTIPVNHGLGKYPAVTVWDSAGDLVLCDIDFVDINNLTLIFRSPFGGTVSCN